MEDSSTTYDVFLSYKSGDQHIVEAVARELTKGGLTVFLDRWYLVPGTPWPEQLEKALSACRSAAIFLGPNGIGQWQRREQYLALDRQVHTSAFPVIPVLLPGADPAPGFLFLNTWIDMREGVSAESSLLLSSAIKGEPPGPDFEEKLATSFASICPYRGLEVFREEDAAFFFGRDAFVDTLLAAVDKHPLVAVVGESGSGKSSVVNAGLIPRLRRKESNRVWEIATMVPGDRPLHSLAAVMVSLLEPNLTEADRFDEIDKFASQFQSGKTRLRDVISRVLEKQPGTNRLMLVVDRWEDLYPPSQTELTATTGDDEVKRKFIEVRQRFIDELLDASSSDLLSVVLMLRGDFYSNVLSYRPLSDRLQGAIVNISELTGAELRQAIEGPATKVRLQFQPGLVERILTDMQWGSLPLLEFVLKQLWTKRQDRLMTHAAYEKIGKLQGAIATHAEEVYGRFSPAEKKIATRVFLRLVRPGTESTSSGTAAKPTRRRISFSELGPESLIVVRKLATEHLIVTGRNEATGEDILDLVHEALISEWSTLNSWINEDLMFLTWRERLRTLMVLSPQTGHGDTSLLRGNLLREASDWLSKREADLSDAEKLFIRSSSKSRETRAVQTVITSIVIIGVFAVPLIFFIASKFGSAVNGNLNANSSTPPNVNGASSPTPNGTGPPRSVIFPALKDVKVPEGVVEIPVVVHVIHRTAEENISDEQIRSQIAALNKDFRARNDDIARVPAAFKDAIADAHIEFVLVTKDPQGRATNGITRTKTARAFFPDGSVDMSSNKEGGVGAWSPEKYLNIWVCHLKHPFASYAWRPSATNERDGVVVDYRMFGNVANSRHVTHEIGHYLNLLHLWGEKEDCTGTDEVDDTPPQKGPNFGRPPFPHVTCNNAPNGDMFMNFMDYTGVGCMFTNGQVRRMHQTLQGARKELGKIKQ